MAHTATTLAGATGSYAAFRPFIVPARMSASRQRISHAEFRFGSMTGVHFDELVSVKQPVDPSLPLTVMEQADRKSLRLESRPLQTYLVMSAAEPKRKYVSSGSLP